MIAMWICSCVVLSVLSDWMMCLMNSGVANGCVFVFLCCFLYPLIIMNVDEERKGWMLNSLK